MSGPLKTAKAIAFHAPEAKTTYFDAQNAGRGPVERRGAPGLGAGRRGQARGRARPAGGAGACAGRASCIYAVKPIPGQKVRFAEEGKGVAQELGRARGNKGSLRFKPADGPGGRRKLVAFVSSYGTPRTKLVVGSYVAPEMARPARPVVKVKRRTLTWKGVRGAANYRVRAALTDGRVLLFAQKTRRVTRERGRHDHRRSDARRRDALQGGEGARRVDGDHPALLDEQCPGCRATRSSRSRDRVRQPRPRAR